jgi:2-oxoglutarate dehydrogenase E2 component (dihydrolipoamide succinyltransferase)
MPTEVVMPQMGESLSEGTVTKWFKKVGDTVELDEPLFEISTDKVDTEVPAPASGVLEEILVPEGQTVAVETVVAVIGTPAGTGEAAQEVSPAATETKVARPAAASSASPDTGGGHFKSAHQPMTFQRRRTAPSQTKPEAETSPEDQRGVLSPAVLTLAAKNQLPREELKQIPGSGMGGRITKKDVKRYLKKRRAAPPPPAGYPPPPPGYAWPPYPPPPNPFLVASPYPAPFPAGPPPQALVPAPASTPLPAGPETAEGRVPDKYLYKPEPEDTVVPMSAMRKKIADHMIWSQRISAQVTSFSECDMHRIVRYRDDQKDSFEQAEGIPLTFLPFVAVATVHAIKEYPIFNASALEDKIVMKKHVHLGVAVALEEGLIVPVVRNADEMNFVGLARAMHDVATRAHNKELTIDQIQGATFTITNPGMFGGLTGTPMISQPQVAILGLGAIQKKPVVIDDAIAIRPIMVLALTFDHRIIDGGTGFQFIERVRTNLEHFELP